jgi:hypothetical protein
LLEFGSDAAHEMAADTVAVAPIGSRLKLQMVNTQDGLIVELNPQRYPYWRPNCSTGSRLTGA